jgi:hypothetical protein
VVAPPEWGVSGGPVRFELKPIGLVTAPVVQTIMSGTRKLKDGFR